MFFDDVSDNPQLNYISARGEDGRLYVAVSNQVAEESAGTLLPDSSRVRIGAAKIAVLGGEGSAMMSGDGSISVTVPAGGLLAFCLEGVRLDVRFQQAMLSPGEVWKNDYAMDADARAMLINVASAEKRVFAYACGGPSSWSEVILNYSFGKGAWVSVRDAGYPFEFSVEVPEGASSFEYYMSFVRKDGSRVDGKRHILSR